MFYVQVQQVTTGRMLGQPMAFSNVREACSYRTECERGGVPEGYVVRVWEATPCCWCDKPATLTVRRDRVQIDPCCDRHSEGWTPTAVPPLGTCCRSCGGLCPEGTSLCTSCEGKPASSGPNPARGAA
jgi:hypothetical protein